MVAVYVPIIIGAVIAGAAAQPGTTELSAGALAALLVGVLGFVVWLYFTVIYLLANGQTIAKKWLGIKVVRVDGSRASFARIFWLRNFLNLALSILPLYGIIDSLFIFSESRQCLHDKIADTVVVNA
jgi:uncharacterized RDD family membrane protein YckC